jgi:RNA polymerase sigma-70 factor (ECF subfamily)
VAESIRELTAAVASGDPEALARLYERWFDFAYAETRRLTRGDESFCLDVVQDAMLRLIRRRRPFDGAAALAAWLRRTLLSCAVDRIRAETRRARRERAAARPERGPDAAEVAERDRWLAARVSRLDDAARQLLHMRYRLGWTLQQIGATLGLGPGAVHGRLARLVAELRRDAREHFDG